MPCQSITCSRSYDWPWRLLAIQLLTSWACASLAQPGVCAHFSNDYNIYETMGHSTPAIETIERKKGDIYMYTLRMRKKLCSSRMEVYIYGSAEALMEGSADGSMEVRP